MTRKNEHYLIYLFLILIIAQTIFLSEKISIDTCILQKP